MAYVTLKDGVSLYYRDQGTGPVIVLIQGLTWSSDYFWQRNFDELARANRVIALDLRGNGRSAKPLNGYTITQCAADLQEAILKLQLKDITVVGVALGMLVALAYIRDFGNDNLARLCLVEGTPRLTLADDWEFATFGNYTEEAGKQFVEAVRNSRSVLTDFMKSAIISPIDEVTFEEMSAETYQTPTSVAMDYINDMTQQDLRDVLGKIDVPTLLVYGSKNNPIMMPGLGEWLEKTIPNARLETFTESGHAPFWDESTKFNTVLSDFALNDYDKA